MKVSFDEIFAAIGVSVMAYFTYKTLNCGVVKKVKTPNISIPTKIKELPKGGYESHEFNGYTMTVSSVYDDKVARIVVMLFEKGSSRLITGNSVKVPMSSSIAYGIDYLIGHAIKLFKEAHTNDQNVTNLVLTANVKNTYDKDENWLK